MEDGRREERRRTTKRMDDNKCGECGGEERARNGWICVLLRGEVRRGDEIREMRRDDTCHNT